MKAAIPAIVQAVKEACVLSVKEQINPHLLRTQFRLDELEQKTRMENLRISGLPEPQGEESEEALSGKVCKLAEVAGVTLRRT